MRFKGQLLVPSEPGPGLRVDLEVAGHHLAVESENGDLGAWPLETVTVRRLEGDTFEMTVAGEDLHFIADDTISFAYSGMPIFERFAGPSRPRSRIRSFLGRLGSGPAPRTSVPAEGEFEAKVEERAAQPTPPPKEVPSPVDWGEYEIIVDDPDDEVIDMEALAKEQPEPEPLIIPAPARLPDTATTPEPNAAEPSCPGTTAEGLPCRSSILSSSGYCYSHDPERSVEDGYRKAQEARAQMKRKGTARLTKVYSRLDKAMRQVERGEIEPDVAMAMALLAQTMCAILDLDESDTEQ